MKIVKFKGGLGNQLFQYAFLRNLQFMCSSEVIIGDLSYYDTMSKDIVRRPRIKMLNVTIEKATSHEIKKTLLFKRLGNPLSLIYKGILFSEKTLNKYYCFEADRSHTNINSIIDNIYFDGYWQSWRNVFEIEDVLRKEITPNFELSKSTKDTIRKISTENSIFIGLRRGDYLTSSKVQMHYGSFEESYYLKAIAYIKKRVENPVFYMFSNDIDWVKKNLNLDEEIIFREKSEQTSDIEELFIMGAFKHAIIVNSTFYWWGAWLIKNRDKLIIAPQNWFADNKPIDIVPDSWIKM